MARIIVITGDKIEVDGSKELSIEHINEQMKKVAPMIAFDFTDANQNSDLVYINGYNILTVTD